MCNRHWFLTQAYDVHCGLFAHMGQVRQHAEAVHHFKDPFAKISESAVLGFTAACSYKVSIVIRHLNHPYAQFIKNTELFQGILYGVRILER